MNSLATMQHSGIFWKDLSAGKAKTFADGILARILIVLVCYTSMGSHALSTDRKQGLTIESDQTEINVQSGTTTYMGDVIFEQGSMKINAEKVVIYRQGKTPTKFIATGRPAQYTQRPNLAEGPVTAKANTLEYKIAEETLLLIENASLDQDGRKLSGNRIEYDVKKAIVKAHSANKKGKAERVRMVIPHSSLKQNQGDAKSDENTTRPTEAPSNAEGSQANTPLPRTITPSP